MSITVAINGTLMWLRIVVGSGQREQLYRFVLKGCVVASVPTHLNPIIISKQQRNFPFYRRDVQTLSLGI
jgi:hypothetical protein